MAYKLICFDLDGVIFKDINFWIELHKNSERWNKALNLPRNIFITITKN